MLCPRLPPGVFLWDECDAGFYARKTDCRLAAGLGYWAAFSRALYAIARSRCFSRNTGSFFLRASRSVLRMRSHAEHRDPPSGRGTE